MGKRTFKEIITFSQYKTTSKTYALFSGIILTPLLMLGVGFSPMYKGLEYINSVPTSIDSLKVTNQEFDRSIYISSLKVEVNNDKNIVLLPIFEMKKTQNSKKLKTGVLILNLESSAMFDLIKEKEFDLYGFNKTLIDNNFLSEFFQPTIYSYVKSFELAKNNKDFVKLTKIDQNQLSLELANIIIDYFGISVDKLPGFILEHGPVTSGYRSLREKFDTLFDRKYTSIQVMDLGQKLSLLMDFSGGKDSEVQLIPIRGRTGYVYKTNANLIRRNVKDLKNQFKFKSIKNPKQDESKRNFLVSEFINRFNTDPKNVSGKYFEGVYENYFQTSAHYLKNSRITKDLAKQLEQFINILQLLNESYKLNTYKKSILNLSELLNALNEKDYDFFKVKDPNISNSDEESDDEED